MPDWKKVSSFNESDKDRAPYVFELRLDGLKLGLTRHVAYPSQWITHFHPLTVTQLVLK